MTVFVRPEWFCLTKCQIFSWKGKLMVETFADSYACFCPAAIFENFYGTLYNNFLFDLL